MTTRINISPFEQARRAELERLTGCPIAHVIEGVCREPGCKNAGLQLQKELLLTEEDCLRLREVALSGGGQLAAHNIQPPKEALPLYTRDAAPIFQTKPRLRCVL